MLGRSASLRRLLPVSVALAGAIASVAAAYVVARSEDRVAAARFERRVVQASLAIEHRLWQDLSAVESTAALFTASGDVTHEQFRIATAHFLARHPSLRAISWNPRILSRDRRAHEEALRGEGFADYRVTERAASGQLTAAGRRDEHVVVQFIEPYAENRAALGFDVASEERRRRALEYAAATGQPSLTALIPLVQEGSPGFLAFWPVYRDVGASIPTLPDRNQLRGFAVGVFHIADVVEGALETLPHEDLVLCIEDVTDPGATALLYAFPARQGSTCAQASELEEHISFEKGGRTWRMGFSPASEPAFALASVAPPLTLFVGLVFSGFMATALFVMRRANADLEREIELRQSAEDERRRLDAKLQGAQRLESLGVLAGGIAHDFNNLLTGILGNADLALEDLPAGSSGREQLEQVRLAATRAAELTRQMLTYSGGRPFEPEVLDLAGLVVEMAGLLEASISKRADLHWELAGRASCIQGEPTQIRQVVMNLITNASDSLEDAAGTITIRVGSRAVSGEELASAALDHTSGAATYVLLEVEDTGRGMDEAELARVFDPFFTTKFKGRGLGLAAVLGIVRTHRGAIWVHSEPGLGTTFTLAFPATSEAPRREEGGAAAKGWHASGTILVVDDEALVRDLASRSLENAGFRVLLARDGQEGVVRFEKHADEIRAVLLDATMPRLGGADALRAMRALDPDIPVILSSGHSEDASLEPLGGVRPSAFLAKPYRIATLLEVVRRVLEERRGPDGPG